MDPPVLCARVVQEVVVVRADADYEAVFVPLREELSVELVFC